METEVVIIQEPVFIKTGVEEASAGVILDHSSMEVDKVNLSTVLDDKITSRCFGNNIIPGEAEVVNGSGNQETEESDSEKGEPAKAVSVLEDSKIFEEKASEIEKDEQGTIFVHEPESFNTNTKDAKILLSDVTLEKEKEEGTTEESEEVSVEKPVTEEDQTETKQEEIVNISKVLIDAAAVEVKDSRTVETSVNGSEAEHNVTESVEEISRNSENIVNETFSEEETAETTKRVHIEAEKDAKSRLDAKKKDEIETEETVIEDPEIINSYTTVHESESLKGDNHQRETSEPVETIKHSENAEQISHEVTGDREKQEDITKKTEEVQESLTVIETPTIQGDDIESKASNDTEDNEHVLLRDIPQGEILVTEAETVDTSTVQKSAILKTLETKTDETDAEPSLDLKEDKEQEQKETVKTVNSSNEVQESNTVIELPTIQGEGTELKSSLELKEEVDQSSKDSVEDEHVLGKNIPQGEIFVTGAETLETKEDTKPIMDLKDDKEQEETEKFEEIASDPALKVDKEELNDDNLNTDQVDVTQTMEEQRGLDSNAPAAKQTDLNKIEEIAALPDVEPVEQLQKPSLESHSEVSEETSKSVDEKIELDQEGQEEVSNILEKKEETVSVLEGRGLGEKSMEEKNVADLTPLQDKSCLPNEQETETVNLVEEETEKHEVTNEEVLNAQQILMEETSDEVAQVSSASASDEREGETVSGAIKIEDIKANEEEQAAVETIEPHSSLTSSLEKQEHGTVAEAEKIEVEKVKEAEPTGDISEKGLEIAETTDLSPPLEASNLVSEFEEQKPKQAIEILEGDITENTEEVKKSNTVIEKSTIHGEDIESKASLDHKEEIDKSSKDSEEHEHVLVRDNPPVETLVSEAEPVDTSTVQESAILKTLETKDDTKASQLDLKEGKEQEETVKTIISSDEVRSYNVQAEDFCESIEPCISKIKDENPRREEFVEIKSKETIQDESSEKHDNLLDEQSGESDKRQENEPETIVEGDETTHDQSLLDLESVEKLKKPSLDSPSAESKETSNTVDENIEEKSEEITQHEKCQEEGSCGLEMKEETVSVPESSELGVKYHEEESCLPNEQEKETEFQKEQIEKHDATNEEDLIYQKSHVEERSDEVIQVVEAKTIEDIKTNEEEQVPDKIQKSLETVGTVDTEPVKSNDDDMEESLNSTHEEIQIKIKDKEKVPIDETDEVNTEKDSRTAETSVNGTEVEHNATVISKNIVNEAAQEDEHLGEHAEPLEAIKTSDDAEEISHDVTGDKEKEGDINRKTEEVQESSRITETPTIQGENIESKASKDTEGNEHLLVRDMPQIETFITEAEAVNTSTVQVAAILKTLETTNNETKASKESNEDTEPSLDLKEHKDKEEAMVKTVISSDEVRSSDVQAEEFGEHTEPYNLEIKDGSEGGEEPVEVKSKETVQDESTEKRENLLDVPSGESENFQVNEPDTVLLAKTESRDKFEDSSSDLVLKVDEEELKIDKTKVDKVDATQTMEEKKGLDSNETEAEPLTDVESVENIQKPSLQSPSEVSEETSTIVDEKIEEKPQEEELTLHQEGQEEEKTLPVPERSEHTSDIGPSLTEKCSVDQTQAEEQVKDEQEKVTSTEKGETKANESEDEHVDSPTSLVFSEKSGNETFTEQAKKGDEETTVRDMPQGETIGTEAGAVDTSSVKEAAILKNLEAVPSPIGGEEESQVTKEDTELSLEVKEDREQEETETVKTVILSDEVRSSDVRAEEFSEHIEPCSSEIKDASQGREATVEVKPEEMVQDESTQEKNDNLLDVLTRESAEIQKPSLESSYELSEETSTAVDEKIEAKPEEEVTLHHESQEEGSYELKTKEETISVPQSSELGVKSQEEESGLTNEQEEEKKLQKMQIEKHESTSEEDTIAHQIPVEEKSNEVIQVSSKLPSEELEGETVEVEKAEEIKANEEEQVAEKIQQRPETFETVESHSSFSSSPDEHGTVADAKKIEDEKMKETEQMNDMGEKGLEISETKDLSLPLEESKSDGTESSELVAAFEERKPKQTKEILEGERKEVDETKAEILPSSETIPQETLSDVVVVQMNREHDATESTERQEEAVETKETTVALEEQTRDIGTSFTEKCSMDQTQPEEKFNEEWSTDEQEVSSTEKGETKTKPEDANLDEHFDSSEKTDNEILIAKTSENVCIKQEELQNSEAPKLEESKEDKSQEIAETIEAIEAKGDHTLAIETSEAYETPSFVSELEDKIPKQIEEIHEETKEAHNLQVVVDRSLPAETSQEDHQTPTLVSDQDDQTSKQVEKIHGEETKANKLQEEAILPTEIVPRESFSEAPVSMLASWEADQVTVKEGTCAGEKQEEQYVFVVKEESVGETKPKESEAEITDKSDDQVETSTKVTKVEDEDTKKTDIEVAEITKEQIISHAPENPCLEQEELKDLGTLQHDVIKEEQSPLRNDYPTGEAEHGDETSSTLPVVEILKELQKTLETERAINDSASLGENMIIEPTEHVQKVGDAEAEPETLEKNLVTNMSEPVTETHDKKVSEKSTASEIIEANMLQQDVSGESETIQEESGFAKKSLPAKELKLQAKHKEEGKVQDGTSEAFEVIVEEKLKEETKEIAEFKEEVSADRSHTEVLPAENILIPSSALPLEESEHVISSENQEGQAQEDANASVTEKTSLREEHSRDFETFNTEQKHESQETIKEDQLVDIKEEKENEEVQEEKLCDPSTTRDCEKTISSKVKKDNEDASELKVDRDLASTEVKEEAPHSVLQNEEEVNEVVTLEKQITDTVGVVKKADEAEHESNEELVKTQAISDDTKINNERDFHTEQAPKDQREEVNADKSITKETLDEKIQFPSSTSLDDQDLSVQKPSELIQPHQSPNQVEETSFEIKKAQEEENKENATLITNKNEHKQDQPGNFEARVTEKETSEQEQKSNDLSYDQEENGTNLKLEVRDDEIRDDGHNSAVAQKDEPGIIEEKREGDYAKTGPEDAIKHGVSVEEKNNASEKIDQEAIKEIYQEESKQTDTVTAIKEEMREEEVTTQESFNSMKNTDDSTEKTKPKIREIETLSSLSVTQEKSSKQKDEVQNQQKREISDEIPKLENLKIAGELQQKNGESEPTVKEPARRSLSDLIQKVKGANKTEDTTTKPHIEEEPKAEEEEDDDGDEHKDDKTSPDSIVMVEARDTVNIIKTHKKSQGILSGVGSKVKHSISKVKKALTGKSSHTTKPSSPK